MKATFRPLRWSEPSTPTDQRRSKWTFKAGWQPTLDLLDRELYYLDAEDCVIEADFTEADIRLDGMPRSNARQPVHPGVRVAFESRFGPLIYSTDSCAFWQHNVRSIGLGLESLRAVDRYGVTKKGEQYTGWKAISAGPIVMSGTISKVDAAAFMAKYGDPDGQIPDLATALLNGHYIESCYKRAARITHPDHGGSADLFQRLQEARTILSGTQ